MHGVHRPQPTADKWLGWLCFLLGLLFWVGVAWYGATHPGDVADDGCEQVWGPGGAPQIVCP